MIKFINENKTFYLNTKNSSYIIKVLKDDMLCHWYYGAKIAVENLDSLNLFCKKEYMQGEFLDKENKTNYVSKDVAPMECPISGNGDFRIPAIITENNYGQRSSNLIYKGYHITKGKNPLSGLPSFNINTDNVDTLEIILLDTVSGYEVSLFYSVFEEEDAITRHTEIRNTTDNALKIVSEAINDMKSDSFGCVMVSHYERLFELVPPSHVHILVDGKIVLSGGQELIDRIDKEGYRWVKELGFDFETEEDKQPIVLGSCGNKVKAK